MSTKEFEYAALRNIADKLLDASNRGTLIPTAVSMGLCISYYDGYMVVYPDKSPRKNPACAVMTSGEPARGWVAAKRQGNTGIYIYKAGDYDVARGCEKTSLRSAS